MLVPLEPLMDVALDPVVDVPVERQLPARSARPARCWEQCRRRRYCADWLTARPSALPWG